MIRTMVLRLLESWSFKYLACLSQHTQQNWTPMPSNLLDLNYNNHISPKLAKNRMLCPILLTLLLLVGSSWRVDGYKPSETAEPHCFHEKGHSPILFGKLQWLYRWISFTFQPFR